MKRVNGKRVPLLEATIKVSSRLGPRARKSDRQSTVRGKLGPAKYGYQIGSHPNVYGAMQEFGTRNMRARPWMRPAWLAEGGQTALNRIGDDLGKGLEAEAAKKPRGRR